MPIPHSNYSRVVDSIKKNEISNSSHRAGTVSNMNLDRIESLIVDHFDGNRKLKTLETGCGKTTVLFSNYSAKHHVFCIDDRNEQSSSLQYLIKFPELNKEAIDFIYGPTQITLANYKHTEKYDIILLDGPHGFPFPEIEYYYIYPHIKQNGLLLIDDIQIPSIGLMFDVIKEDAMFDFIGLIGYMGVLMRNAHPVFDPYGDGWWIQNYNRRRTNIARFKLNDRKIQLSSAKILSKKKNFEKYQLYQNKERPKQRLSDMIRSLFRQIKNS